jgi:hypothetical protein
VDRSNGHAPTDVERWAKLTFESDHSTGADQSLFGVGRAFDEAWDSITPNFEENPFAHAMARSVREQAQAAPLVVRERMKVTELLGAEPRHP